MFESWTHYCPSCLLQGHSTLRCRRGGADMLESNLLNEDLTHQKEASSRKGMVVPESNERCDVNPPSYVEAVVQSLPSDTRLGANSNEARTERSMEFIYVAGLIHYDGKDRGQEGMSSLKMDRVQSSKQLKGTGCNLDRFAVLGDGDLIPFKGGKCEDGEHEGVTSQGGNKDGFEAEMDSDTFICSIGSKEVEQEEVYIRSAARKRKKTIMDSDGFTKNVRRSSPRKDYSNLPKTPVTGSASKGSLIQKKSLDDMKIFEKSGIEKDPSPLQEEQVSPPSEEVVGSQADTDPNQKLEPMVAPVSKCLESQYTPVSSPVPIQLGSKVQETKNKRQDPATLQMASSEVLVQANKQDLVTPTSSYLRLFSFPQNSLIQ